MLFTSVRPPAPGARLFLLLRLGVALCFIGHGAFGLLRKEAWLDYFSLFGIAPEVAHAAMPIVGAADVLVGILALLWPSGAVLAYAAGWALMTAALRPLAGEGPWEMLERAGNYGVPFAALVLSASAVRAGGWLARLRPERPGVPAEQRVLLVLRWTSALLLLGHGMLALQGKPLLLEHGAALGMGATGVAMMGAGEIAAAVAVLLSRSPALFLGIALWKLGSEWLFVATGAPAWEWIERGGSYVAPLAAAVLLVRARGIAPAAARVLPRPGFPAALALLALAAPVALAAQEATPRVDAALLARLGQGGLVLACRHAVTDPDAPGGGDPFLVRPITAAGERQARRLGELVRALGIPVGEVLSSPFARNLRTAELAFGRVRSEGALWSGGGRAEETPRLFSRPPASGNRVLMTHQGVLYRMLPVPRRSIEEGDCVVVEPRGADGLRVLGQASNADWERLLREHRPRR